jgi:pimeloyl-ACP methyl ester carboxylesterase
MPSISSRSVPRRGPLAAKIYDRTRYLVNSPGYVILVRAMSDLQVWHRVRLLSEFRAAKTQLTDPFRGYLGLEKSLVRELEEKIVARVPRGADRVWNRFAPDGGNNPLSFPRNWNRTVELIPTEARGRALLLHGLTDSPYSLRRVAEILHEQGFHVVGLRLPGHGTAPSGLLSVRWRDWMAATELAAGHLRSRLEDDLPFLVVGYSNGAALAVLYALRAIITNADESSQDVVERTRIAGEETVRTTPLNTGWPRDVYSLSHTAVPFPPDDPIYGRGEAESPYSGVRLGRLEPRGERELLRIPADWFTRLRANPFFDYVERRLVEVVNAPPR